MKDKSNKLIYSIIGLGVILRLIEYFHNKSLWLDETYVALNVIENSFKDLLGPPDLEHRAPILFMEIEKLLSILFGSSELSLKIYPLFCGIGSIFLFYLVCKQFLQKHAITLAVFLFCTCYALIHYSGEVKPYMGDVFWELLIYLTTFDLIKKKILKKDMIYFALLGAITLWAAYSVVFILAGVGITILLIKYKEKEFNEIKKYIGVFSIWAISFGIFYKVSLMHAVSCRYVIGVFTPFYVPNPFGLDSIFWLWKMFMHFLTFMPIHEIVIFFLIIGSINLWIKDNKKILALFLPVIFAIIASYLQQYPLWQRALLFIIPPIFIISSHGAIELFNWLKKAFNKSGIAAGSLLIFFLIFIPLIGTGYNAIKPHSNQEVRPSLEFLKSNLKTGDTIYLHKHLQYGYKYYADRFGLVDLEELESPLENEEIKRIYNTPNYTLIIGKSYRYNQEDKIYYEDLEKDLQQLKGKKRVWLFLSNMKNRCYEESKFFIEYLDKRGKRLLLHEDQGMEVYLYDLSNF